MGVVFPIIHETRDFVQFQEDIMNQFIIRLTSVPEVEAFVSISTSRDFRIFVSDGNQIVNGKSFMQMFCLNLAQQLTVTAECAGDALECLRQEVHQRLAN